MTEMAFNPSPKVAAARDFGNQFGADIVFIVHINTITEKIGYASWGQTPKLCAVAKGYAESAYHLIANEESE
jgi:hypothetical protein